jgi:hypothetical protein
LRVKHSISIVPVTIRFIKAIVTTPTKQLQLPQSQYLACLRARPPGQSATFRNLSNRISRELL